LNLSLVSEEVRKLYNLEKGKHLDILTGRRRNIPCILKASFRKWMSQEKITEESWRGKFISHKILP